jgi:hypothetical protein
MIFKIRQGLNLQQSPKQSGLVSRFLHGNQVLNLTEGHKALDSILWASIIEDSKLLGVLGTSSWVVWIHEKLQLDPLRLVRVIPIKLVQLLHLGNEKNGEGWGKKERSFRVRLVVYGYSQVTGVNFYESFAPVINNVSFNIMLIAKYIWGLEASIIDVEIVFLYGI